MHRTKKVIALLLALIALAGLAACGSDDDETTGATTTTEAPADGKGSSENGKQPTGNAQPSIETIVVRNGVPVDGIAELEYDAGEQIRFKVSSNEADEIHVHGYDVAKEIPAGAAATISFPADIEGIFEVELHGSGKQIAELRVNP